MKDLFLSLTKKERALYICSLLVVFISCICTPTFEPLVLVACCIGVSALIFVAKGYVIGQILTAVFALLYGIVSYDLAYYGEMITYLGMSTPIALLSAYTWWKHPYQQSKEVEIVTLTKKDWAKVLILTMIVTYIFYYILLSLKTSEMLFSTISVTTSFLACYFTYLRSPYYALGYALNDLVLIVLWILASIKDIANLPMIFCFLMFLVNDLYGFYNWLKMQKRQNA